MQCNVIDPNMANIKYGFANTPTFNIELSYNLLRKDHTSDKAFKALNISITTKTDKLKVDAFYFPHEK